VKIAGVWKTGILESGAFESIATISPSTGTKTVTFNSIPQGYKSLQVRYIARTDRAGTDFDFMFMRMNGVTSASYSDNRIEATGTGLGAAASANSQYVLFGSIVPNNNNLANCYAAGIVDVIDYTSTAKNKTISALNGSNFNSSNGRVQVVSGALYSTSAVTSISFTIFNYNFLSGTSFALYGIK
jgi:hypothetical protein